MHAAQCLPVAAGIADCAATFVRTPLADASASLHQYWTVSRQRLDHWCRSLAVPLADDDEQTATAASHHCVLPVIEEILYSEVLTRVWAAAATAHDLHQGVQIAGPVARSIYLGHQQARHRALLTMLKMQTTAQRPTRRLNVLRQKCERWTDLLLAYFPLHAEIEKLSFDPRRSKEFAIDLQQESEHHDSVQTLTMASLKAATRQAAASPAANGALNQQIVAGVIGCLPAGAVDADSLSAPLWQSRIDHVTSDTLAMVEELLALD